MSALPTIWIVEDDPGIRFIFDEILGLHYHVRQFEAVAPFDDALAAGQAVDLVIADLRLPRVSFLSYLRAKGKQAFDVRPLIVVSSVDDTDTLRLCYEYGARDYITKPFFKAELIVKVERALRGPAARREPSPAAFEIDVAGLTVRRGEAKTEPLTLRELQIMALFSRADSHAVSREALMRAVWSDVRVGAKTLDVHLHNLRKKLEPVHLGIRLHAPGSYVLTQERDDRR